MRARSGLTSAGKGPRRTGYAPSLDLRVSTRDSPPPPSSRSHRNIDADEMAAGRLVYRARHVSHPRSRRLSKRAFDLVAATILLLPAIPVMFVLGCAVKLTSQGPAFYQSERHGAGQTRFFAWKLRSMVQESLQPQRLQQSHQSAAMLDRDFKLRDDPRVTRVGRLLRKSSLDELPQLFNVVKGEMSMVGPRPKLIPEQPRYGEAFHPIMRVKPGLTGLWQTSGRNNLSFDERIILDLRYVTDNSMKQDIAICLRTARQLAQPSLHGAY